MTGVFTAEPLFERNIPPWPKAAAKRAAVLAESMKLLLRRLSPLKAPSEEELAVLKTIVAHRRKCPARAVLLGEGAPSNRPRFLLDGWACRQLILPDGRRQIFSFLVPGDILAPDYEGLLLGNIVALTPVSTGDFPQGEGTGTLYTESALLSEALCSSKLERERLLSQQVFRLGGMNGRERTAHLLLEFHERLSASGLCSGLRMPFPLTQETLGDALGMSTVHVNRTLRQLKHESAVAYVSRDVLQVDAQKLAAAAQLPVRLA